MANLAGMTGEHVTGIVKSPYDHEVRATAGVGEKEREAGNRARKIAGERV